MESENRIKPDGINEDNQANILTASEHGRSRSSEIDLTLDEDTVFGRRSSLARSPTIRGRADSLPNEKVSPPWDVVEKKRKPGSPAEKRDEGIAKKTKEAGANPGPVTLGRITAEQGSLHSEASEIPKERWAMEEVMAAARKIMSITNDLQGLVYIHSNTNVEIKKAAQEAERCTGILLRKLGKFEECWEEGLSQVRKCTAETQTENRSEAPAQNLRTKITEALKRGGAYEDFETLKNLRWPKEVFKKVREETGDILAQTWEWDLALLVTEDFNMESREAARFKERHQGVAELQAQEAKVGEVAYLMNTIRIPGKEGNFKTKSRYVYHLIVADAAHRDAWELKNIFQSCTALRKIAVESGREKIAIAAGGKTDVEVFRRILEFTFSNTGVEVMLVRGGRRNRGSTPGSTEGVKEKVLWNLMYDGILRLPVREGVELVDFADDVGVIVTARTEDAVEEKIEETMNFLSVWLEDNELELAPAKTEAVVLKGARRPRHMTFRLRNTTVIPGKKG